MKDEDKTKEQLIQELVAVLERVEAQLGLNSTPTDPKEFMDYDLPTLEDETKEQLIQTLVELRKGPPTVEVRNYKQVEEVRGVQIATQYIQSTPQVPSEYWLGKYVYKDSEVNKSFHHFDDSNSSDSGEIHTIPETKPTFPPELNETRLERMSFLIWSGVALFALLTLFLGIFLVTHPMTASSWRDWLGNLDDRLSKLVTTDPHLEAVIEKATRRRIGNLQYVHPEDLKDLYANKKGITRLRGIQRCKKLEILNLADNQISNIKSLKSLTNLRRLILKGNQIVDISPLVRNSGIGEGDDIDLRRNPLNNEAYKVHIPTLQKRGVKILFSRFRE